MKQINWKALINMGAFKIKKLLPLEVTVDGEPSYIVCNVADVIVVSDLHIRVRNMLKAQEKRARMGMPAVEKVTVEDITDITKDE